MKITLIAAIGKNRELGYKNNLIWKIPEDLNYFKDNTINKYIVMGINTFNSLPRLLPNRKHIVLTRRNIELDSSVIVVHSVDELLEYINNIDEEIMIIGGSLIYNQMIEYADKMLLTEIDDSRLADVYFPEFNIEDWDRLLISSNSYNDIKYNHVSYTRKKIK